MKFLNAAIVAICLLASTAHADGPLNPGGSGGSAGCCTVAATKSDQQTGTSPTAVVTPLQQQQHDSAAKAWAVFTSAATPIVGASYNVSSVTKSSTGQFTVNFTTPFASTNYVCHVTTQPTANFGWGSVGTAGRTTGAVPVATLTVTAGSPAFDDPTTISVSCFGRQ